MTTTTILATPHATWCAERLRAVYPSLEFIPVDTLGEAESAFPRTEVVVCGSALTTAHVSEMPGLRWVQSYISGTDEIEQALVLRPDVTLTSARGIHGPQMAEMALLHMLFLSRNGPTMARNQRERAWQKVPQRVLEQRVVGVVGLGVIGESIARLCTALGMKVYGFSRTDRSVEGVLRVFDRDDLRQRAPELDFLVLSVPYSPETDKLVDVDILERLKPSAILINLSRGGVVDEEALIDALRAGRIGGAGLDVFATEPLPSDSPLWDFDNVFLTPHVAGFSDRYHEQLLPLLEQNFGAYIAGGTEGLLNVVPRAV